MCVLHDIIFLAHPCASVGCLTDSSGKLSYAHNLILFRIFEFYFALLPLTQGSLRGWLPLRPKMLSYHLALLPTIVFSRTNHSVAYGVWSFGCFCFYFPALHFTFSLMSAEIYWHHCAANLLLYSYIRLKKYFRI